MQKQLDDQAQIVKELLIGVYKNRKTHPPITKEKNLELFAGRLAASVRKIHMCDISRNNAPSIAEAQIFQKEGDDLREQQIIRTAEINNFDFEYELRDQLVALRNEAALKYAQFEEEIKNQSAAILKERIEKQTPGSIRQEYFDNKDAATPKAKVYACTYYLKLFSDCDIALSGLKALLEAKADKEELAEVLANAHTTVDLSKPRYHNYKDAKLDFVLAFGDGEARTTDPEVLEKKHYPRVRERFLLREELYDSKGEFDEFKLLAYSNEEFNSLLNDLRVQRDGWEKHIREGQQLTFLHPKRYAVLAKNALNGNKGPIAEAVVGFIGTKISPLVVVACTWVGIQIGENKQSKTSDKPKQEVQQTAPLSVPVKEDEKKPEPQPKETSRHEKAKTWTASLGERGANYRA